MVSSDVVHAARVFLVAQPEVRAVLGASKQWDCWLFTDKLYVKVSTSESVAAVLTLEGNWAQMNEHNTMRFPRLGVTFYADAQRDDDGRVVKDDTRAKLLDAFDAFNKFLHRVSGASQNWGDLRVIASKNLNEPYPRPMPDGDNAVASAQVFYALTVG